MLEDNKESLTDSSTTDENIRETVESSSVLSNSPVLKALRSHLEKWYPETVKHNKLEADDMLESA